MRAVMQAIASALEPGAILSDVGSVKAHVVKVLAPLVRTGVHFIPGHPIAGTEHSGPSAGFAELFVGRWCVLTPGPEVAGGGRKARRVLGAWAAMSR